MNPLLNLMGGGGGNNLMRKAFAAMLSGQSPEAFMQSLAKTDSRFQGLDFNNLENTANQLCREKGVDVNQLTAQVTNQVQDFM